MLGGQENCQNKNSDPTEKLMNLKELLRISKRYCNHLINF